jgi:hypothetical protein
MFGESGRSHAYIDQRDRSDTQCFKLLAIFTCACSQDASVEFLLFCLVYFSLSTTLIRSDVTPMAVTSPPAPAP